MLSYPSGCDPCVGAHMPVCGLAMPMCGSAVPVSAGAAKPAKKLNCSWSDLGQRLVGPGEREPGSTC